MVVESGFLRQLQSLVAGLRTTTTLQHLALSCWGTIEVELGQGHSTASLHHHRHQGD